MKYYSTTVTAIGEEVATLLESGVLILYADGAPPALAEVSVQHRVEGAASREPPPVGSYIKLGELTTRVSAVGSSAWNKVRDLGHVVINFNGSCQVDRPGEICVENRDRLAVGDELRAGSPIVIAD